MNKLVAVLIIVIILLGSVCGVLFYQISNMQNQISNLENQTSVLEGQIGEYQNQTGQLENQINELEAQNLELENTLEKVSNASLVQITAFTVTGFRPMVNVVIESDAFVTVQNFGNTTVEGLTVTFESASYMINFSVGVGRLEAGEAKNVSKDILWALNDGPSFHFVATLKLGDVILDERFTDFGG